MSENAISWQDHFEYSKERKVYTYHEHGIPGLRMIGYHSTSHALASLKTHYHENCFEFTYLVKGHLQFSVGDKNYPLSGGEMFLTFPDEPHSTGNLPLSLHQMYWFQLDVSDPEHFLFLDPYVARIIIDNLMNLSGRVFEMKDTVESLLSEVFSNITGGTELGRIHAGISLSELLCHIFKRVNDPVFQITPDIGRTTEYISDHIHEEIRMEDLAEVAMLSVSRLKQKFKAQLGTSPRNFINFQKIEVAKRMLESGSSATDTAMKLSFSSSNYFSAVFRRYTSLSPTEYILQIRQKSNTALHDFKEDPQCRT